jgi:hypothetical protein
MRLEQGTTVNIVASMHMKNDEERTSFHSSPPLWYTEERRPESLQKAYKPPIQRFRGRRWLSNFQVGRGSDFCCSRNAKEFKPAKSLE